MVQEQHSEEQYELPVSAGERLRAAREELGMSVAALSGETRITERHLEMLEEGDYAGLPGRTYAMGFARSYASAVGLDPNEIAHQVRGELDMMEPQDDRRGARNFEPGDPGRVPSAKLAWVSVIAAIVVFVAGAQFLWSSFIAPAGSLEWLTEDEPARAPGAQAGTVRAEPAVQAAAPSGPVIFTALEEGVWVKFYDASGRQLMQKQMAQGETYTVPGDVEGPQIWTGRPDALAITIGGREIPKLAEQDQIMKDVPVTASALLDRQARAAIEPGGEQAEGASPTG